LTPENGAATKSERARDLAPKKAGEFNLNTSERIDQLEAENAEFRARLAKLEPKPAPAPVAQEPPHRLITVLPNFNSLFRMPTARELHQLHLIVSASYPKFGPANVSDDEFRIAFLIVGQLHRSPQSKIDKIHSISWWLDELTDWAKVHSIYQEISALALCGAVLAHGDVRCADIERWPVGFSTSLLVPYCSGIAATDKWSVPLSAGKLMTETTSTPLDMSIGYRRNYSVG
jgi:hypothetical protein